MVNAPELGSWRYLEWQVRKKVTFYLGFRWENPRLKFARGRRLSSEGVPAFPCRRWLSGSNNRNKSPLKEFVLTSLASFVLKR